MPEMTAVRTAAKVRTVPPDAAVPSPAGHGAGSPEQEQPPHPEQRDPFVEPPLPNGVQRTYLTSGGATTVAVAFLVFLAILLAYSASSTSWAPW
jgi:hypothetical protein